MVVGNLAGGRRVRISCERGGERQAWVIATGLDLVHGLMRDPQPIGQFSAWLQPRSARGALRRIYISRRSSRLRRGPARPPFGSEKPN
jgi:hypothetical protein